MSHDGGLVDHRIDGHAIDGHAIDAERSWADAAELFRCLASPIRVGIVAQLMDGERSVGDLVAVLGVSQPLVSQHLKILREQCLVVGSREGRRTVYRLMDDHVGHIVADAVSHTSEHDHPKRTADLEESP